MSASSRSALDNDMRNERMKEAAPEMFKALKSDWADALYSFLLSEFAADPDSGHTVTADARPHFNSLINFMTLRAAVLEKVEGK